MCNLIAGGVLLGCPLRPRALCVSSGVSGGCAPVESSGSAGIGFAACAGKHYFVIGTKAAFAAYHMLACLRGSRLEPSTELS